MTSPRTARRLPLVLAVLAAGPLLLGACGSSNDTATPPATEELADAAPDEIKADVDKVNAYRQGITSFEELESMPADIEQTGDALDDISKEKCGIE